MTDRVFVAMSGGVDSSLAAALLADRGEDVVGVWMRLTPAGTSSDSPRCCGTDEAGEQARRAAAHLGIPFYALDYAEVFARSVVDPFVQAYASGETPNPCVACNGSVKFEALLGDVRRKFGATRLATGHYARVANGPAGTRRLLRARDRTKDQSYALYMLGQEELAAVELPIGELDGKDETRRLARDYGLPNAAQAESMDICFIGGDYRDFVRDRAPEAFTPGPIERADGTMIGAHARHEIATRAYRVRAMTFTAGGPPAAEFTADAVLRYRGTPLAAEILMSTDGSTAELRLGEPALVAPGQAAVLYRGDEVIGGGVIDRPLAA